MDRFRQNTFMVTMILFSLFAGVMITSAYGEEITITDGLGREVQVPLDPDSVICSGPGCLRYLTYIQAQDKIIGVDDIETNVSPSDSRPYTLANPQFEELPIFGEYMGKDDPEKIVNLGPKLIFKTYTDKDTADQLQEKTGIPVVALNYGDLTTNFDTASQSLTLMGKIMNQEKRAGEVVSFFKEKIDDLQERTKDIPDDSKTTAYIGGVGCYGSHGLAGTSYAYTPFQMVNVKNVAAGSDKPSIECGDVSKESIIGWDPDMIFIDLGTLQLKSQGADAVSELEKPEFSGLKAVQSGKVYALASFNWYTTNQDTVLADAYYIGKLLYPEQFSDIDPAVQADEVYSFLVGKKLFADLNKNAFEGLAFTQIPIK